MKNSLSSLSDLATAFGRDSVDSNDKKTGNEQQQPSDNSLVYSTKNGRIKQEKPTKNISQNDGFAKVRRETKGRKGKGVTTITGLGLDNKSLKELAKQLKKTCGSGGSVIGEVIEIQGDKKEEVKQQLEKKGFKVKFIGG